MLKRSCWAISFYEILIKSWWRSRLQKVKFKMSEHDIRYRECTKCQVQHWNTFLWLWYFPYTCHQPRYSWTMLQRDSITTTTLPPASWSTPAWGSRGTSCPTFFLFNFIILAPKNTPFSWENAFSGKGLFINDVIIFSGYPRFSLQTIYVLREHHILSNMYMGGLNVIYEQPLMVN